MFLHPIYVIFFYLNFIHQLLVAYQCSGLSASNFLRAGFLLPPFATLVPCSLVGCAQRTQMLRKIPLTFCLLPMCKPQLTKDSGESG